ncbi:MAG TPA: hypothetical protein VFE27_01815 [Acidobacteriaceae bacterium]|nr:hypothetical protein [Acidobacteriaceae bacterium]
MTAEQLQAARAAHWRQNQSPILTLEDAESWLEQHPLCLYLPRHAQLPAPAPSFVEACIGGAQATPGAAAIDQAQSLLTRLVASGTVVALNLLGAVSEQPDFLAHRQALPYILCLRADADWKHAPQKSSGHKVSPLVLELWKALDRDGVLSAAEARETLGRELTEAAVLRGLCELWQALRISPVFADPSLAEPGQPARWELLRVRHRDALATASATSQVTALSLLVSMYLQSVYAASSEEIEIFLSPAASRSRVREAVRGLSATRQIHSLSMDAQTYYFLEDGLPEFAQPAAPPAGRTELRPALGASAKVEIPRRPLQEHRQERRAGPMRPAGRPARPPSPAALGPGVRPAAAPPAGRTEWKGPRRPAAQWRPGVKPPAMGGRAPGKQGGFRPARSFLSKTASEPRTGAEAPRKGTRPDTRGQGRPDKRPGARPGARPGTWSGAQKRERPAPWARPGQGSGQVSGQVSGQGSTPNPRPPHSGDRRSSAFRPAQNPRPGHPRPSHPRPSQGGNPVRGIAPNRFQGGRPGSGRPGSRPPSGRPPNARPLESPPPPGAKRPWAGKRPPDAGRQAGQPGVPFRSRLRSLPGRSGSAAPRSGPSKGISSGTSRGTGPVSGNPGSNPGASAGRGGGHHRPGPGGYAKSGTKRSPGRDDQRVRPGVRPGVRPPFVPGSRPAKSKPRAGATSGRPFGEPAGKPGKPPGNFRGRKPARKKPGV